MKKALKSILLLLLSVAFMFPFIGSAAASDTHVKIDYVAFGDSVAAGVRGGVSTEEGSDYGYTDNIAANLKSIGALGIFNKNFCVSGMTAAQLAEATDALNDPDTSEYQLVNNAEIATLDIGANDLLAPIKAYIKEAGGVASANETKLAEAAAQMIQNLYYGTMGTDVQSSVETILQNILNANGNIKIYVMGYYNPLPIMSSLYGVDLDETVEYFNRFIKAAISNVLSNNKGASIIYIDTMTAMAENSDANLSATDIHPTEAGYKVIANEFWQQIKLALGDYIASAAPTKSAVVINGKPLTFAAYNINGSNYFKLRDLAKALSGTGKQFEVSYDSKTGSISLTSGKGYTPVGGELFTFSSTAVIDAVKTISAITLDSESINPTTYLIGGSNYIKLRDLADELNFSVEWNADTNTISIDTAKGYTAPAS